MGFYDTAQNFKGGQNQPYNLQDVLLATKGLTSGIDALVNNSYNTRQQENETKANMMVSDLLKNTNADNYENNMAKARELLPYASKDMQAQAQQFSNDINNQRTYNLENKKVAETSRHNTAQEAYEIEKNRIQEALNNGQLSSEEADRANRLAIAQLSHDASIESSKISVGPQYAKVGLERQSLLSKQDKGDEWSPIKESKQPIIGYDNKTRKELKGNSYFYQTTKSGKIRFVDSNGNPIDNNQGGGLTPLSGVGSALSLLQ
jgi:hypothetical protein